MTESNGPDGQDGKPVPGKKKRGGRIRRLRPYAFAVVAMAVVFGISAVIGAHVRSGKTTKVSAPANAAAPAPVPTGPSDTASPEPTPTGPKLSVPVRPTVPVTVTVYEDLRSPQSKAFADAYQPVLDKLLTTGQMQVYYRLVTVSDGKYGGDGSLAAANAAACAQDQGRFTQFMDQLYKNQPDPKADTLAQEGYLKKLALKAHKIRMGTFEPCLEQRDHLGWVEKSQADFAASGFSDVPVVQINDTTVKDVAGTLTPEKLRSMVLAEAERVVEVKDGATPKATATTQG